MTKLTVITVVYNDEKNIESTLKSVLAQTHPLIEFVVIDGGSTDGTKQILEKYSDSIDVLVSEPDHGIYDAMNKGVKLCTGSWLHFLNSADVYADNKAVERMMSYAGFHPEMNLIYTKKVPNINVKNQDISYKYLSRKALNHQSVIFSRKLFENRLYDISYEFFADYEYILTSVPVAKSLKVDVDFVIYNTEGVSSDIRNVHKIWKERAKIITNSSMPVYLKVPAAAYSYLAYLFRNIYSKSSRN